MNTKTMNYYEILGISLDASEEEIRKAYLELVKKYHPDVYKEVDGEEIIKAINVAYDTLINPVTKEKYDRTINNDTSSPKSRDYETAEYYKTGDKQVLNGCINSGQYVLDRLIRIKEIIIKHPQNKKTIMLGIYAKELLENYIGEVEFASNESFGYINMPLISEYINKIKLIQSNCETILIENYQNILKQKKQLQNQYNIKFKFEDGDLNFLIFCSAVTFTGTIANTLLNTQIIMLEVFLPIVIVLNLTSVKKIYNNIKYREELKENQNKIKKLDRFIAAYNNQEGQKII